MSRGFSAPLTSSLVALALSLASSTALAVSDPDLDYWTIETDHFNVSYERGLEPVAVRVAELAEAIHTRLSESLGYAPDSRTEIVLTDDTDGANGSATSVPFNTIRLFVTAPDDMSPLGDYDDWYLDLVTHEYTHILHTDNISGVASIVNAVLGKTLSPNQIQPRWVLEGLAVVKESEHSSAGRLRSSLFDMFLRADVVADRVMGLDQMSSGPWRYPQGNVFYLYGSRFLAWISDIYGPNTMRAVSADYGGRIAPWAINRSIRRATGRTYTELYEGFREYLDRRTKDQIAAVDARGRKEGVRLTKHGYQVAYPTFVPKVARTDPNRAELVYFRNDQHERSGLYRFFLDDAKADHEPEEELVARTNDVSTASYGPDGALYFTNVTPYKNVYPFHDLVVQPRGETSPRGDETSRRALTEGARALSPDISSDGRDIVFTANSRGTTYLRIARVEPEGKVSNARTLVPSARYEQAYTPRFSPDGRLVAYSVWTAGGFRDIRIVDVAAGTFINVTLDRALDLQPSWSHDGKTLYFSSDRGGIFNVYAYELSRKKLSQVTNVVLGAFQPTVSDDGKTLVYVGYTTQGYDLYRMELDPSKYLTPLPPPNDRPDPPSEPSGIRMKKQRYFALPTLAPRNYSFELKPSSYGPNALTLSTTGSDVVGLHGLALSLTVDPDAPDPIFSATYAYRRLSFDMSARVFHTVAPRADYRIGDQRPLYDERINGITTGVSYPINQAFGTHGLSLSYTMAHFSGDLPVATALDPYASTTVKPPHGTLGLMHVGYGYSSVEGSAITPGARRGVSFGLGVDFAGQETGSTSTFRGFNYSAAVYLPMPFAHALALRSSGAIAAGNYARAGFFYVGGYDLENTTLIDSISTRVFDGAFVLRGYPPGSYGGKSYALETAEYRFPIAIVDRGVATLPGYLRRIDGSLFVDWGGAWTNFDEQAVDLFHDGYLIDSPQLHTSVGAEIWTQVTLGYYLTTQLRLGYAYGFSREAEEDGQLYFIAAGSF